jgi:hypothetical protein
MSVLKKIEYETHRILSEAADSESEPATTTDSWTTRLFSLFKFTDPENKSTPSFENHRDDTSAVVNLYRVATEQVNAELKHDLNHNLLGNGADVNAQWTLQKSVNATFKAIIDNFEQTAAVHLECTAAGPWMGSWWTYVLNREGVGCLLKMSRPGHEKVEGKTAHLKSYANELIDKLIIEFKENLTGTANREGVKNTSTELVVYNPEEEKLILTEEERKTYDSINKILITQGHVEWSKELKKVLMEIFFDTVGELQAIRENFTPFASQNTGSCDAGGSHDAGGSPEQSEGYFDDNSSRYPGEGPEYGKTLIFRAAEITRIVAFVLERQFMQFLELRVAVIAATQQRILDEEFLRMITDLPPKDLLRLLVPEMTSS